jgi:hypothetical protein
METRGRSVVDANNTYLEDFLSLNPVPFKTPFFEAKSLKFKLNHNNNIKQRFTEWFMDNFSRGPHSFL